MNHKNNVQVVKKVFFFSIVFASMLSFISCSLLQLGAAKRTRNPPCEADESSLLDILLNALFLERKDLGIARALPANNPFLLKKTAFLLQHPIQTVPFAAQVENKLREEDLSIASLVDISANLLELSLTVDNRVEKVFPVNDIFEKFPDSSLKKPVKALYHSFQQSQLLFQQSFSDLKSDEIVFLKGKIQHLLFTKTSDKSLSRCENEHEIEEAFFLASKIKRQKILSATNIVALSLDRLVKTLRKENHSTIEAALGIAKGMKNTYTLKTPLGNIIIGSTANNNYTGTVPLLIIDLGGDDQYSFDKYAPFSVIVDLAGNDIYKPSKQCWLGSGVLGIGFIADMDGNDFYLGKNFAFGCGFLGAGIVFDKKGNDRYLSGMFSQGAGSLGMGILFDGEGDDFYQSALYSQGFGYVGGGGLLVDKEGNDTFLAGRVIADFREKADAFQSFSQGFGLGARNFASGGIGILYDKEGDDLYEGSYFSQGASYWLAIGMLIDSKGNDRYRARRYAQGAATHWTVGALIDSSGNDSYLSWGVSQGCGHDRSIGILLDKAGNDSYNAEWLCQGAGNSTGRGIFIDERGNDTYEAGKYGTQGDGRFDVRRDEASIGVFVDGGGEDNFFGTGKTKWLWKSGHVGAGINVTTFFPALWKEHLQNASLAYEADIARTAVKSNKRHCSKLTLSVLEAPLTTEQDWVKAADALAEYAPEIIPELISYLEIKDVSVRRALEETFKRLGSHYLEDIQTIVRQNDIKDEKKSFLLYVLGEIGNPLSRQLFLDFLQYNNSRIQALALRGLYKLKQSPPLESAIQLAQSKSIDVRKYLALSLQNAIDPDFIPVVIGLLGDEDFNVRYEASHALKKFGQETITPLRKFLIYEPPSSAVYKIASDTLSSIEKASQLP